MLGVGYYNTKATDVLISGDRSPILGSSSYYSNDGSPERASVLNDLYIHGSDFCGAFLFEICHTDRYVI